MSTRAVRRRSESWPLARPFVIARGAIEAVDVVVVEVEDRGVVGRGECRPYPRYGESVESVVAQVDEVTAAIEAGLDRAALAIRMPAGAARNAVDAALLDLEARQTGTPPHALLGLDPWVPRATAFTLSIGAPSEMGRQAALERRRPLLKAKLSGDADLDVARVAAVRAAAPSSTLLVDANESWPEAQVERLLLEMQRLDVRVVEQPLPSDADGALSEIHRAVPVCADESCHTPDDLDRLSDRYDMVNIKADKAGGPTTAARLLIEARARGLGVMVGCMVSTSLAIAPMLPVAARADFVDLDGPLLLRRDRTHGIQFDGSTLLAPDPRLWGG